MKVLHIINTLEQGGAEKLLHDSLIYIKQNNSDIENVVVSLFAEGEHAENLKKEFNYQFLDLNRYNFLSKILKVRKYIKKNKIGVIHAHLFEATIFSRFLKSKKVKVVNTYHTGFHNKKSIEFSKKRLLLDKITKHKVDAFIFVSKKVDNDITKSMTIKTHKQVLPNFCNPYFTYSYRYREDSKIKIVCVGNLREQKNYMLILKSLNQIPNLFQQITIDVFGEGELKKQLTDYIEKYNLPVSLKGTQKISSKLLSNYDLFLMSSKHEGMPIALIEAIATGLPSLLNDIPELRETAMDSAIYFDRNSFEDLSNQILYIFNNKTVLEELSGKTKRISKLYSIENHVNSLLKIYNN